MMNTSSETYFLNSRNMNVNKWIFQNELFEKCVKQRLVDLAIRLIFSSLSVSSREMAFVWMCGCVCGFVCVRERQYYGNAPSPNECSTRTQLQVLLQRKKEKH